MPLIQTGRFFEPYNPLKHKRSASVGEIIAGRFTLPENPVLRGAGVGHLIPMGNRFLPYNPIGLGNCGGCGSLEGGCSGLSGLGQTGIMDTVSNWWTSISSSDYMPYLYLGGGLLLLYFLMGRSDKGGYSRAVERAASSHPRRYESVTRAAKAAYSAF